MSGAPPASRSPSVPESQLIAGLFAVAVALALGGMVLLAEAPASQRAEVAAAFRADLGGTLTLALAGNTVSLGAGAPPTAPPGPSDAASAAEDDATTAAAGVSPRAMSIPTIDLDTSTIATGMTEDRNLEVPGDPQQVGWYRGFSEPGDPGVSVLLGHVDSRAGPGVFFRLPEVETGARITVERSDGRPVTYEVTAVDWYPKDEFPTLDVYTSERDEVLRLITCGGEFDAERRTYLENVVVSAVPVEDTGPGSDVSV